MKDYLLQVKIKNNRLHALMLKNGHKNLSALARATGIAGPTLCNISNLKLYPLAQGRHGGEKKFRRVFQKLADFFGVSVFELWPEGLDYSVTENSFQRTIDYEHFKLLATESVPIEPERSYMLTYAKEAIEKGLEILTPREREALTRCHMNGETLEEIGETMDVSRERVRQIIARAIRKLRHPILVNNLKQYWDEMPA